LVDGCIFGQLGEPKASQQCGAFFMPLPLFSMVYEVEQRDQVQNLGARQIDE
jgi:hypothetical protein